MVAAATPALMMTARIMAQAMVMDRATAMDMGATTPAIPIIMITTMITMTTGIIPRARRAVIIQAPATRALARTAAAAIITPVLVQAEAAVAGETAPIPPAARIATTIVKAVAAVPVPAHAPATTRAIAGAGAEVR